MTEKNTSNLEALILMVVEMIRPLNTNSRQKIEREQADKCNFGQSEIQV